LMAESPATAMTQPIESERRDMVDSSDLNFSGSHFYPGRVAAAGFHNGVHELHAAQAVFAGRHEQCAGWRRSFRIIRREQIRDVAVHLRERFEIAFRMSGWNASGAGCERCCAG